MSQIAQEDRYYRMARFLTDVYAALTRQGLDRTLTGAEVLILHRTAGFVDEIKTEAIGRPIASA